MFITPPSASASSMPFAPPNAAPTTPNSATMPAIRIVVLSQFPNIPRVLLALLALFNSLLDGGLRGKFKPLARGKRESGEEFRRRQFLAAGERLEFSPKTTI